MIASLSAEQITRTILLQNVPSHEGGENNVLVTKAILLIDSAQPWRKVCWKIQLASPRTIRSCLEYLRWCLRYNSVKCMLVNHILNETDNQYAPSKNNAPNHPAYSDLDVRTSGDAHRNTLKDVCKLFPVMASPSWLSTKTPHCSAMRNERES